MNWLLGDPLVRAWLILVVATSAAFSLRTEGFAGLAPGVVTLALAYFKARLVILEFMEIRHAPKLWRGILEGWLLIVSVAILVVYGIGLRD